MEPADQTACLNDMQCNWDQTKSIGECNAPELTSHFCGECHSGPCWEVSTASMCFTFVETPQKCAEMGGTIGPWGLWHCVFNTLLTEDECLPPETCPSRPAGYVGERHCPSSCIETAATSMEECAGIDGAWWNNAISKCELQLTPTDCAMRGNTTEYYYGRIFRPGHLDTEEKCAEGRCSVDPMLTAAQCADPIYSRCSKPCHKCRARNYGSNLCYSEDYVLMEDCLVKDGEWNAEHSTCIFDFYRTEDECMANNNTFVQCEDLDISQCTSMTTFTGLAREKLQCYANYWDQCESSTECESVGDCNDWELQNWYAALCMDGEKMHTSECTGVCVQPYTISSNPHSGGMPQCSGMNTAWTKMGCVDYTITTVEGCSTAGGTWQERAFTESDCLGHGTGCAEQKYWQLSPKSSGDCIGCGGTPEPYYRWTPGHWITGQMIPLEWKSRQFASINRWQPTLNWTRLHTEVESVATIVLAKTIKTSLMCKLNPIASIYKQIVCALDTNTDTCSEEQSIRIGEQDIFSGLSRTIEWSGITVHVADDSVSSTQDTGEIVALKHTTSISISAETVSRRRNPNLARSPYDPSPYEVVTNHVDYIVGQLISDGVTLIIPEETTINVCIDIDGDIPEDPEEIYPTLDFAGYNASIPKWWPLELNVTRIGNQACADVDLSGTYYAILRLDDWEFATGIAPTTGAPTPGPTLSPTPSPTTAAPTAAPTTSPSSSSSSSGLSAAGVVAIVLIGIALIVIIVMIIVLLSRRRKRSDMRSTYEASESRVNLKRTGRQNRYKPTRTTYKLKHGLKQK